MIITYPISDNFGNEYLIRIEDCQNLPDEIMKELGNIKNKIPWLILYNVLHP